MIKGRKIRDEKNVFKKRIGNTALFISAFFLNTS